jgi:hypothetical protein
LGPPIPGDHDWGQLTPDGSLNARCYCDRTVRMYDASTIRVYEGTRVRMYGGSGEDGGQRAAGRGQEAEGSRQ